MNVRFKESKMGVKKFSVAFMEYCKMAVNCCVFLGLFLAGWVGPSEETIHPMYAWPLGNQSLYNDVFDKTTVNHTPEIKCFSFLDGPTDLPYSVLDKEEEEAKCFDVFIEKPEPLRDMTISLYVFPDNDASDISGTLFHYQSEDREIMRIRTLANTFLVSFRDEYGMSAGTMYLVNFLTAHAWNHVTVTREFQTGRIVVYKDGVEMYNEDDEFSDIISFPHSGMVRIGKSLDPDDENKFEGAFACVQLYNRVVTGADIGVVQSNCLPENWKNKFDFHYDARTCLTDPPRVPVPEEVSPVVTLATVLRESLWRAFMTKFALQDSGRSSGYLRMKEVDRKPIVADDSIGTFNTTDDKICARLCMRVDGCKSVVTGPNEFSSYWRECTLFDDEPRDLVESPGYRLYNFRD